MARRKIRRETSREWSRYYGGGAAGGVEVLHAHFVEHTFARHAHDTFVVGLVEAGVQAYSYRGARHVTPAGRVFLVNPGEPHTGEPAARGGYVYRTMYPSAGLLERIAEEAAGRSAPPSFAAAVLDDDALAGRLSAFHRALAAAASPLAVESLLRDALTHLVLRHAQPRAPRRAGRERAAVRRARDYLEAGFAEAVSLSTLGAVAGLSPFHLARAFRAETGLPPHAYLDAVRVRRARELLDRSVAIAEAAVAVGYADQSHLSRRFKRHLGITPGQYARARAAGRSAAPSLSGS
jgi:AraC-like DNA-binding protein